MNRIVIILFSNLIFFSSCYVERNNFSQKAVAINNIREIENLSLFDNEILFEDNRSVKRNAHISLLYIDDSISYISTGKKNPFAKNNVIYQVGKFMSGRIIVHSGRYRYDQMDSIFFTGDYCFRKISTYEIGESKTQLSMPFHVKYVGYLAGESNMYRIGQQWTNGDASTRLLTLNEFVTNEINKFQNDSTKVVMPFQSGIKNKAQAKMQFFRLNFIK
jgi:hypothetical protein